MNTQSQDISFDQTAWYIILPTSVYKDQSYKLQEAQDYYLKLILLSIWSI